jgi:hypothetical protein
MMIDLIALTDMAREEFADIVVDTRHIDTKLRIIFVDGSYIDFWWSEGQEMATYPDLSTAPSSREEGGCNRQLPATGTPRGCESIVSILSADHPHWRAFLLSDGRCDSKRACEDILAAQASVAPLWR